MFAEIVIPLALPRNYTWEVPARLEPQVRVGCRVEVNLGKQKKYAGVIKALVNEKPAGVDVKEILNLLDPEPVVHPWQLGFWEWLASYYCCTEGEVMAAALPAHFKLSSETVLVFNEEYGDDFSTLDSEEYMVAEALLMKQELRLTEVQQILDTAHVYPIVNKLIGKKVCHVWESLKQTYAPRKDTFVLLQPDYSSEDRLSELLNNWTRAPKQMELLLGYLHLMKTEGEVTKAGLLKKSNATDAQLKGLVEKGILRTERRNVDRIQYLPKDVQIDFTLTPAQDAAFAGVQDALAQKQVCLLQGVTSSGKTQIYIRLIEQFIRQGRQVLYMLPEIALTAQIVRRLQKYFGGHIGIYHSRFNHNERVEIWNKVKSGELKVVLGARSSLFMPYQDLGLIICDEEHDSSYKQQDPAPRYHGRDAAIYLAGITGAKVLLGSATPSLETYHNAQTGKFGLVEIRERYGDVKMPTIDLVDLRAVPRKPGEKVMFSMHLLEEMKAVIERGKQIILFQNRRGYAPLQLCTVCGWIAQCKHCDVSLTFHKFSNKLKCHYCGQVYPPMHTCGACGSDKLVQKSFGTERIEEVLEEQLPKARVARMDFDAIRNKNAHDVLIQQFEQKKIDILVGTQMVVKGLDFDNVELVGVIDADGLLHFADFRVHERAFQLMEQVSGRAGRRDGVGEVLIQTNTPNHPLLQYVMRHDYNGMYAEEIEKRKQFFYPPYSRIIMLHFRHKEREVVTEAAHLFTQKMTPAYGNYLVGPAEPTVNRVRNQYLMELMLKLPRDSATIARCKEDIQKQCAALHFENRFKKVQVIVDVDAV
ncbi:primosomal protein N' [Flaviaesturariibacter flavus]|uniref:Replication restart protein PriA n=1 Tax=Flaviaesturariibacter flavus TaxID=2502780 RepID=A0A4R1BPG5_9BACT|nr:primosomal protein N' [Flaviaesturariibacter flavus]TCJ19368.1 primosomal protein N' [Flaviaesturariibacter flavus]